MAINNKVLWQRYKSEQSVKSKVSNDDKLLSKNKQN
jgi:hypothetical protein